MKTQALITTINELNNIIDELWGEADFNFKKNPEMLPQFERKKFQLNIINKTPECSDTWEFEDLEWKQQKK